MGVIVAQMISADIVNVICKMKSEHFFILGICFDLITTMIGIGLGFKEGNYLGLQGVFIGSLLAISFAIFTMQIEKRPKFVDISYISVGILRGLVGLYNLLLIINYVL